MSHEAATLTSMDELWTDDGYVLILRRLEDGRCELWDPQANAVDSVHASYDAAVNELRQDEYTRTEAV